MNILKLIIIVILVVCVYLLYKRCEKENFQPMPGEGVKMIYYDSNGKVINTNPDTEPAILIDGQEPGGGSGVDGEGKGQLGDENSAKTVVDPAAAAADPGALKTATSPTGNNLPEPEFTVPTGSSFTTPIKNEDQLNYNTNTNSSPTINLNKFMVVDDEIENYRDTKLDIQNFINNLVSSLNGRVDINDITKLLEIIVEFETNSGKDYSTYKDILKDNFDSYKMYIGVNDLKLKTQLKMLLGNKDIIKKKITSEWPCMYYNKSTCPSPRCKLEDEVVNADDGLPYTRVVCVPSSNDPIIVDKCDGYYGYKNCPKHAVSVTSVDGTEIVPCEQIGLNCVSPGSNDTECSTEENLLNIYGNGVLHDTVIATKCLKDNELENLPIKYINEKSLEGVNVEELCKSKQNAIWDDTVKQCYDTSDCYSRNSDTCSLDHKCYFLKLFSAPPSKDSNSNEYVPQGFCF